MAKITRIHNHGPIISEEADRSKTDHISADHRHENGWHSRGHKTDAEHSASKPVGNSSQERTAVRDRVTAPDGKLKFCKLGVSVYAVIVQISQPCCEIGSQAHILLLSQLIDVFGRNKLYRIFF